MAAPWCFNGKNVLVTGGARGIGLAIVEEFAKSGADIYTCALESGELDQCLQDWNSKGYKVSGLPCNLTVREERENLMTTVGNHFNGKLDILVNNAGLAIYTEAKDCSPKDWSLVMSTNLEASYHLSQLAYPLLKATGNGSIVFVSSASGVISTPGSTLYGTSKAAINHLTKNLACEWAKDDIRVNAVAPWIITTPLTKLVCQDPAARESLNNMINRAPLRRAGETAEVSGPVAFLCSPMAAYITGHILCIDGGASINGCP
ncbi:PREDICTED: tropinone reductase homolog isoform X1 [Ipomoea nil]|uniref:tropinone reductase homolog isoform X1 n=1 Tax=Ipomoea nil TaxID=35883 RepID=UPI000900F988|nr:PREDICTED: tropinone reductase homolog isoform X1 [Ipomoea nil]